MAASLHGTAYVYGIGATNPTNAQILSISLSKSDALVDEVPGSDGMAVTVRSHDQRDEMSCELRVLSTYTAVVPGALITIVDSGTPSVAGAYMIKSSTLSCQSKDFYTYSITGTKFEGFTVT